MLEDENEPVRDQKLEASSRNASVGDAAPGGDHDYVINCSGSIGIHAARRTRASYKCRACKAPSRLVIRPPNFTPSDRSIVTSMASARLLQSSMAGSARLLQSEQRLFCRVASNGSRQAVVPASVAARHFSQTSSTPAPNQPGFLGLAGFQNSGLSGPTSFFQRPSLPANTVIRFVPQQTAWIVERMGKFNRILEPGLAILVPFLDRIAYVKSLKEAALEIPSQSAITADNVTLELDGVLYTRVFDAYKAR